MNEINVKGDKMDLVLIVGGGGRLVCLFVGNLT